MVEMQRLTQSVNQLILSEHSVSTSLNQVKKPTELGPQSR